MNAVLDGLTRRGHSPCSNPGGAAPHSPVCIQNKIHFDVVGPNESGDIVTKQRVRNVENIMATYGLASAGKMLSTSTKSGSQWAQTMAIGTGTTVASSTHSGLINSTQLCGTFSRSDQGNMTMRFLGSFDSTGGAMSVQEIGIFASNVGNDSMICRSVLTGTQSVNRGASDVIQVSYDVILTTA